MNEFDSLENAIQSAISEARTLVQNGGDRVLLLLTEEYPQKNYGFNAGQILPHNTNGRLVFPLGINDKQQRQYLISFDPRTTDDPSHPDPGVPVGWNWSLYGEIKPPKMLIILTELSKDPAPSNIALTPQQRDLEKEPLAGFQMFQMSAVQGHKQYAVMIDPLLFNVQITNN